MKRLIGFIACLALVITPFALTANSTSETAADQPVVIHEMLLQNDDTGTQADCDTPALTCVRQGHSLCDDESLKMKTEELTRAALQCAREECRMRECTGIKVRSIEREIVQGGYSCGVTVTVTYCCTGCPD